MQKHRVRRTRWINGCTVLLCLSMLAPAVLSARSGDDADWIVSGRAPSSDKLDLTFEVTPQPLVYGRVHDAIITVANGTATDQQVAIKALLGEVAHFVAGDQGAGFAQPEKPEQQRTIVWPTRLLPSGAIGRVSFRFLVSWDVSGDVYLEVDATALGVDGPIEVAHLRETPRYPDGSGVGFFHQYGAVMFFFLLFVVLQLGLYRYMRNRGNVGVLKGLSLFGGVLLLFFTVSQIWNALEPWISWQATTCEVLDVRYAVDTTTSSSNVSGGRTSNARSTTRFFTPLLTLRYDGPDKSIVSTGFRHASSAAGDMGLLEDYRAGTTTECYFDPADPGWVVVVRDFGISTIVFSLLYLLAAGALVRFGLRRR